MFVKYYTLRISSIMINIIPIYKIISYNKHFSNGVLLRPLESIYSTYTYYNSHAEQITSIVCNFVRGHYFIDGNKRTSCIILSILSDFNNLKLRPTNDNLDEFIVSLITNKLSIHEHTAKLFNYS